MGGNQNKDRNIDIYLETSKQLYLAGEYVQGTVYVNCQQNSPFSQLNLKLQGKQEIQWTEEYTYNDYSHNHYNNRNGHQQRVYIDRSNEYRSYQEIMPLFTFPGQIQQGQYNFPFKLLLPQGMAGSIKLGSQDYISYYLIAELLPSNQANSDVKPQFFSTFLNIDEPLRAPLGPTVRETTVNPKCCGCFCCGYGTVRIVLECDKNFIRPGDHIRVKALIDNSMGSKDVTNIGFRLKQNVVKVKKANDLIQTFKNETNLHSVGKSVGAGQQETIQFEVSVPNNYSDESTAIGNILMNYHTLQLYSSMGCCSGGAKSELHLVYHSSKRRMQENKKESAPSSWSAKVSQPVVFNNLRPYMYTPQSNIPFNNRGNSGQSQNNLSQMQNYSNNPQSNSRLYPQY